MSEKLKAKIDQHTGKIVVGISFGAMLTLGSIVYAAGSYVATIDQHTEEIRELKTDVKEQLKDIRSDIKVLIERSHK